MEENKEVVLGTLYDINKGIVQNSELKLSEGLINSKKEIFKNFLRKHENQYYMLLSNERKDYTIFNIGNNEQYSMEEKYIKTANVLIDECLFNRGELRGFDLTKNKDAIEIWLLIDNEAYVYYFFPYDSAIINIEEEF